MPQRIRAGCDWLKEYGTITAQLCHSAFVRVATVAPHSLSRLSIFATAHSCGLRPSRGALLNLILILCHSAFVRVATAAQAPPIRAQNPLPQRIRAGCDKRARQSANSRTAFATAHSCGLRRTTLLLACIDRALPQRIRAGCDQTAGTKAPRQHLCHSAFVRVATAEKQCSALRICCEKVDSFSSVGESGLALTIFPFSFAAKATYVAINDSFGRAIDRFFWCEPHRN